MSVWNAHARATRLWPVVALGAIGVLAGLWFGIARIEPELVPKAALDSLLTTEFADLSGNPVRLSDLKGKTLIVNFWGTWCAPCKEEMPDLARFQIENSSKNVQIVGIGIDSVANMRSYANGNPVSYPLLTGTGATISLTRELGNSSGALPYTLVINSENKATFVKVGRISIQELERATAAAHGAKW